MIRKADKQSCMHAGKEIHSYIKPYTGRDTDTHKETQEGNQLNTDRQTDR